jgi:hypothetical protein
MFCEFAVLGKIMENKRLTVGVPLKVTDGWLTPV